MEQTISYVPVAQYLRMSTEHQQYSLTNQEFTIRQFAERHCRKIVKSYVDAGKSGLVLKHRRGLIQLLNDVVDESHDYKEILVYDVSRWGRFQDVDEAAFYEFLCKRSGVKVRYCAEQFADDESMSSVVMKTLKRIMASEYSRELSEKTFNGAKAMILRGFSPGAVPSYGLRRMLCSSSGEPKLLLHDGQQKNIKEDRVKLVPGPTEETKWVHEIFRLFTEEKRSSIYIAKWLNDKRAPKKGVPWNNQHVLKILRNQKYVGSMVWGTRSMKLRSRNVPVPKEQWTIRENAIQPIIDRAIFDKAQKILLEMFPHNLSETQLISKLRALLRRKRRLSARIINECRSIPSAGYYEKRFDSLQHAFDLVGYRNTDKLAIRRRTWRRVTELHHKVVQQLREVIDFSFKVMRHDQRVRARHLRLSDGHMLSIAVCRFERTLRGSPRWRFQGGSVKRHGHVTLLCLCNASNTGIREHWLMPSIAHLDMGSLLEQEDRRMQCGVKLKGIRQIKKALKILAALKAAEKQEQRVRRS